MKLVGIAGLSLLGRVGAVQLASWGNSTYDVGLGLGSVWEFSLPTEWVAAPPLDYSYGRCNYAAVTATNVGTGVQETGYIRYGIENHGSCADSHCSGDWGRFCMVNSAQSTGVDDFPYFNTWVHHSTPNCRTTSDSGWGGGCGGSVLTFWALGGSGWETVYAWSGKVYGTAQVWTRTMTAGETIRVGFDAAGSNAPAPPPPTPAPPPPTPPPTPSPTPGAAAAVGDPHLQNVHGERFDLMKPGKHVLINIPRGVSAEKSLLRVQADARHLGGQCADMYFQEVNVTGSWAEAKQAGGYHYSVNHGDVETPEWAAFGKVGLKVVHGRTDSGLSYLNVYVKHLGRAGFAVGGLLGEDDHEDVITPAADCAKSMSLLDGTGEGGQNAPLVLSVAEATLA